MFSEKKLLYVTWVTDDNKKYTIQYVCGDTHIYTYTGRRHTKFMTIASSKEEGSMMIKGITFYV